MDDQLLVRELHRRAHLEEEPEALVDVEPPLVAVGQHVGALDVLHRVERMAVRRHASIDQPRDAPVLEPGEDPPLLVRPALDERVGDASMLSHAVSALEASCERVVVVSSRRPRRAGASKYGTGLARALPALVDLLLVRTLARRRRSVRWEEIAP